MKKTVSLAMIIVMVLTSVPLSGFVGLDLFPKAAALDTSGQCGDNAYWSYDEASATLTISGEGKMWDFVDGGQPWGDLRDRLQTVIIEVGLTSIGVYAFNNCGSLASAEIPNSVTSIGDFSFRSCNSLISVQISDSVTNIGEGAFQNCSSLTNVEIPGSVTGIGSGAFYGCNNLLSMVIPDSVMSIGDGAFEDCSSLTSFVVGVGNTAFSADAFGCLYNKDKTVLIQYPIGNERESFVIPNSVTSIGYSAFEDCVSLICIEIPDSVKSIGNSAFADCSSLTSVEIPNSVTSIGGYAFAWCDSLTSIEIPESVISIGDYTFAYCDTLASVEIPDSVTNIGEYAFDDTALYQDECNWSNGVLYIGNHLIRANESLPCDYSIREGTKCIAESAFANCTSLISVKIPDSVTIISISAFCGCSSLTIVTIPNSVTDIGYDAFSGCIGLTSVEIPDSVTRIGSAAFMGCNSLICVEIPDSVTSIEGYAFADCDSLTSVTILNSDCEIDSYDATISASATIYGYSGSTAQEYAGSLGRPFVALDAIPTSGQCGDNAYWTLDENGTLTISGTGDMWDFSPENLASYAMYGQQIVSVVIEEGITGIGECAFIFPGNGYDESQIGGNLTEVTIPTSVTKIGSAAFSNCYYLQEVIIPDSVTNIGTSAFEYCTALQRVILPANLTTLEYGVFLGCTDLLEIEIPEAVETIGANEFMLCDSLQKVVFYNPDCIFAGEFEVNDQVFQDIAQNALPETTVIYGYSGSTAQEYAETYGRTFVALDAIPTSGQCGDNAYWSYDEATATLTISGTGAMWGDGLFSQPWREYMADIQTCVIEEGITSVGDAALFGAYHLTDVSLPSTLESIGMDAFMACVELKNIMLPDGLQMLGDCAFQYCASLEALDLPDSITAIGGSAFNGCTSLTSIKLPEGLTTLEDALFENCFFLKTVEIPASITAHGPALASIGNVLFYGCDHLETVVNRSSTLVCADRNFYHYALPEGLDENLFYQYLAALMPPMFLLQCGALTREEYQSYAVDTLVSAFGEDYATVLEPITTAASENAEWLKGPVLGMPEGLTFYCYQNSAEHEYCENNLIPYSFLTNGQCGDNAFWNYDAETKTMTISGTGEMWSYELFEGLDCPWSSFEIETAIIEEGITSVGNSAFYDHDYFGPHLLAEVYLPSSLETIDNSAFYGCQGLKTIHYTNPLKRIGAFAFASCYTLENFEFKQGLEFIGEYAFSNCYQFVGAITIPKTVKTIENNAFLSCTHVSNYEVDSENTNYSSDENGCLYNKDQTVLMQYPVGNERSSFFIPNTVTTIAGEAFGSSTLTEIIIPESVTDIGEEAFIYCKSLKTIIIPQTVTRIGEKAFGYAGSNKYTDFTLFGYIDTAAENYAIENDIPFTILYTGARVTGVSLNKTVLTLEVGSKTTLTTTIAPSDAENKRVSWSSNDTSVATVDKNGVVTAKANGTAVITAKTNDGEKTATCKVTVKTSVTGVSLSKTSDEIIVGRTLQLSKTVKPSTASNQKVTWTSDKTSVATVNSNGLVTAKAVGSAKITVKTDDGGKTATCTVTVKPAVVNVTGVTLDKTSLKLAVGMNETLSATVSPSNATNKSVKWSSSNAKVAKVDSSGKVTAVAAGTATITVKTADGNKTKKCSVSVLKEALSITAYPVDKTIKYINGSSYTATGQTKNRFEISIEIKNNTDKTIGGIYVEGKAPGNPLDFFIFDNDQTVISKTISSLKPNKSTKFSFEFSARQNYDVTNLSLLNSLPIGIHTYWNNSYDPVSQKCTDETKHIFQSVSVRIDLPINYKNDSFKFLNEKSSFVSNKESNMYHISKASLKKISPLYYASILAEHAFKWKGSCLGMSALISNIKAGRISSSFFGANGISDLKMPVDKHILRDVINIVQCAQKTTKLIGTITNVDSQSKLTRKLWKALIDIKDGGPLPIINLSTGGLIPSRHAVVGYSIVERNKYWLVSIWDPDKMDATSIKLKHDLSGLYEKYNGFKQFNSIITDLSFVDVNTYAPGFSKSSKKLSAKKVNSAEDETLDTELQNYTIISLQDFKEVTISNSKKETLTINCENESVTGDLEATIDTAIGSEDDPIVEVIIKEKEGEPESYQITSSSDYTLSVNHDQVIGLVRISGSETSCVTYSSDGLIKVEKDEGSEYEMALYAYDMAGDVCHVSLSGDSTTEASIENCESGILLSSDDLENETVSVDHYDDELSEDYVSSLAGVNVNEVLLKTDTDNATELYINCDENPDHETKLNAHIYKKTVVEPTCTDNGYYKYACTSCDDEYREEIPMLGHTPDEPVVENEVLSTCTADGHYDSVIKCMECGEELNRETVILEAAGHMPSDSVVERETAETCTANGGYDEVVYCADCGNELSREHILTVSALGHTDPDSNGKCTRCGEQIVPPKQERNPNTCKWCGKVHEGFFQKIIGFFHKILAAILGAKY